MADTDADTDNVKVHRNDDQELTDDNADWPVRIGIGYLACIVLFLAWAALWYNGLI